MRFAWLRTKADRETPAATSSERLIHIAYNVAWWIPVVLPILGVMSYRAAFVAFLAVTVVRALVNGYRVNVMGVEVAERLPLRSP